MFNIQKYVLKAKICAIKIVLWHYYYKQSKNNAMFNAKHKAEIVISHNNGGV